MIRATTIAVTLFAIAAMYLCLAVAVWRARPGRTVNRLFAFQCLIFAGYTVGNALAQANAHLKIATILAFGCASLIPPTLLTFTARYPTSINASSTTWAEIAAVAGLIFAITSVAAPDWLVYDVSSGVGGLTRRTGPLYELFVTYVTTVVAAGLLVFARKWRSARERQRAQLNYFGLGLAITATGVITLNLVIPTFTGRSNFSFVGPYFGLPFIALTAHSIIRYRFMDLRIVLRRGVTLAIATALSVIPLFAAAFFVSRPLFTQSSLAPTEMVVAIGTLLGVGLLIPPGRDLAEALLDRYICRSRRTPGELLRQASAHLARTLELEQLQSVMTGTINTAVQPEGVAFYLKHREHFRMSAVRIPQSGSAFEAPYVPPPMIMKHILTSNALLIRDELDGAVEPSLRAELDRTKWALVLPLLSHDELLGIVSVGCKRSGDPYFAEDIDALVTLSNHAGSALNNAILYEKVALTHESLNSVVRAMQNGVIAVDHRARVTLMNPSGRTMLGISPDAPDILDVLPDELRHLLGEAIRTNHNHQPDEITLKLSPTSEPVSIFCTTSVLRDRAGRTVGAVVVFNDLSPFKELDRERARAENFATLQRFTQAIAHEIGNPLVPIKTLTQLLPSRIDDRSFLLDLSRIVTRELERIERLVHRLRRLAPGAAPSYADIDLLLPLQHAIEVIEAEASLKAIDLVVELPPHRIAVMADGSELEEVFLNLLTNALEAIAEVSEGHRFIRIRAVMKHDCGTVEITDSGPGLSDGVAAHIFQTLITSKPRGSGLGLAICQGIVQRHGGRLTATNAGHGGALFTVELPLSQPLALPGDS